ncbi:regulatory protein RecX [Anaerosalibacter bizertensis]|uniref:Regulatory protein RecX n=1 Tax=Anaerosalibacter bizertensis TaxID=932217 RepID=A0A844FEZ6_9FIRM|nr:regulatory protein RecX [Anaerosalibacter bizertensis]MBV1817065.1 recombination regulator RecX [Bacteroidales bacterium MSK.15.36]HHV26909.1 regulatory protein RecX [Tissierellia bacterium]MBU5292821.1 recombination regulator RecX [Anaerosalibacter bizertensis]MCB5559779.1 recombination regulator RecX [Anaerosalibacter bizertensis]MCG4564829.1 recombination regulator RecX [Anaerosalibacter bizertensis]
MKITKIKSQNNKDRVNIYLDGEFAFGLSLEIAYKYNLKENMEIDESYIENVLKSEEQNRANDYALKFLSNRWRTEKEIVDKMIKKGFDEEVINETLAYLKKYNFIDDRRFAEIYTEEKVRLKKLGSYRIKHELQNKGVDESIASEIVEKYSDNEYERAMELATKKIKSYKNDDKNAIYRKLGGYLQRRGYSFECVSKVLRELVK